MDIDEPRLERETITPTARPVVGVPFAAGNKGRPKGIKDKRHAAGEKAAQALAAQAWDVIRSLLVDAASPRYQLEAAKIVIEYAHGKPTQRVDIDVTGAAESVAARIGAPVEEILAIASRLADEAAAN